MSDHRFKRGSDNPAHHNTTVGASHGRMVSSPVYRCLYCRKRLNSRDVIPAHEAQCDARFIVTRGWAQTISRAKAREAREAR